GSRGNHRLVSRLSRRSVVARLTDFQSRSAPDPPRGSAAVPQIVQELDLAHGIHALPEPGVVIDAELALRGQSSERRLLEHRGIAVEVVEDLAVKDEEASVDPAAG